MRIIRRYSMFYCVVFYSLLSILSAHVAVALLMETSAFNIYLLYDFMKSSYFIILLFGLFVISAISYSKWSLYLYYAAFLATLFFLLASLYQDFNKAVLFIIFFYCTLSYFLGQGWKQALYLACYNPYMSEKNLDDSILIKIGARVKTEDNQTCEGLLANWDEMSCFVRFKNEGRCNFRGNVKVITEYNGREFEAWGKIVSSVESRGIGIIFDTSGEKKFNWQSFYNIMDEISFTPEYLVQ